MNCIKRRLHLRKTVCSLSSLNLLSFLLVAALVPWAGAAELKPKYGPAAAPRAIPLSAESGYFRSAQHAAPDFWALIPFYLPQFHGAACSVASVTMILNAAIAQRARKEGGLSADDPNVDQKTLLDRVKAERWKERILGADLGGTGIPDPTFTRGLTLDQLGRTTEAAFQAYGFKTATATVHRFEKGDPQAREKLRALLTQNEQGANDFLLANFNQKVFTDDAEVGHISPVAAFDRKRGRVLVLETDREYYEPYWVSLDTFLAGLQTQDSASGKLRGLVHLRTR